MATPSLTAPRPADLKDATPPATTAQRPVAVFKFEAVSAAVFADTIKTDKGEVQVLNVSVRRAYRDADGAWQHTHTLRQGDLLPAILALLKCHEFAEDARSSGTKRS